MTDGKDSVHFSRHKKSLVKFTPLILETYWCNLLAKGFGGKLHEHWFEVMTSKEGEDGCTFVKLGYFSVAGFVQTLDRS